MARTGPDREATEDGRCGLEGHVAHGRWRGRANTLSRPAGAAADALRSRRATHRVGAVAGRAIDGAALPSRRCRSRAGARGGPAVRVPRIAPFEELLREPLARPRFYTVLLGVFGVVGPDVARAIGLYAVIAASVRQRYAEIGVRLALGARPADVAR